jgi:hypothetical protein
MPEGRNTIPRREDTWDDDAPSVSDQAPPTYAADGTAQLDLLREMAMPTGPTARRRREDTWDMEVAPGSDSSPPLDSQDRSAQQTSINPTALSNTSGLMSWDEILSSGDTPASHGASSLSERVRLPRLQEAPQEATQFELHSTTPSVSQQAPPALSRPDHPTEPHRASSFEPESAPPSMSQQEPSTRPRAEALLQPRRLRHRVDCGLRFQPYRTPPIPRNLDEVQIPDGTELAVMEQIHGKPGGMSESLFHKFRRGYGVPPDIAFNMRVQSMIGVYPSGLIYVDYGEIGSDTCTATQIFRCQKTGIILGPHLDFEPSSLEGTYRTLPQ